MASWYRFETAAANRVYIDIADDAAERLHRVGYFAKAEVLKATGYGIFEDDLRWDYVRRMIEEKYKTELVPLCAAFFKRESKDIVPGKLIAGGHGKRTAGYAITSQKNEHLVLARLNRRRAQADGNAEKANKTRDTSIEAGADQCRTLAPLPRLKELSGGGAST
jgi:hypothetical protein